jgi:hypothetical protein
MTINGDNARRAGSMAEISSGHVVSDLPDLTGVALVDLPAVLVPHESEVLERAIQHPEQDHVEQKGFMPA